MIWFVVSVIAVWLVALVLARFLRRGRSFLPTPRAMKQAAGDPDRLASIGRRLQMMSELKAPARVDDAVLRDLVTRLLDNEDREMVFPRQALKLIGAPAEPYLLEALDDPRFRDRHAEAALPRDSPYENVVELLAALGSEPLIDHLEREWAGAVRSVRTRIAMNIAHVGSEAAIAPTLRAIDDPDGDVRRYAVMGIGRAATSGHASAHFLSRMFDALTPLAAGEGAHHEIGAAEGMLEIDRRRALAMLRTTRFLRLDNPALLEVIRALNANDIEIDHEGLWPIHEVARTRSADWRWARIHAEVLVALAGRADDDVRQAIDAAIDSEHEAVREGAAEALLRAHRLPTPRSLAYTLFQDGVENASEAERAVSAVMEVHGEVNNGGFSQYFFNPYSDRWPTAIEAARTVGAHHLASQLERAVALFGRQGPSLDRDRRLKQYARMSDRAEAALDELDAEHGKDRDRLDVLLARYMIEHKEEIRPRRTAARE